MRFSIAETVDAALDAMAQGARPVAGGSDLVVGARHGKAALPDHVVAIDRLAELATVEESDEGLRVGALITHATLMDHHVIAERYSALADAAALVGSPSTRNVGTIGGNIMNGSPAMDTGAPLVVLGAQAELRTQAGHRLVPLDDLWTAPGETSATSDELCTAVVMPKAASGRGSAYVRLEYRRAMEIAVVGAAARVDLAADGTIADVAVALTAVAPTIISVGGLDDLAGSPVDQDTLATIADRASDRATPISDLRATDNYRRHTIGVMARRAVDAAAKRAAGYPIAVPVNRAIGIGAER